MTRNVVIGGVLGLAVALLLSPIFLPFQTFEGQLAMAAGGGSLVWLWERRKPTAR